MTSVHSQIHSRSTSEVDHRTEPVRASQSLLGDGLAVMLAVIFFAVSVGFEKLNPRNLTWLTFGDQQAQLLGWWFFADDRWRWPLGANPNYGWDQMNSIVFTDSIPGLAIIFKVLDLSALDSGQYFGVSLLLGSIGLFVGARRLFSRLGLSSWSAMVGSALLGTTPLFWWMQRWYVALSTGLALLVWAILFYFDDQVLLRRMWRRWPILLVLAAGVQAYLIVPIVGIFVAALANRLVSKRDKLGSLLIVLSVTGATCVGVMYLYGYYTVPSKWAQTGGYGWYSANVLGLFDGNRASRLLPDLPSISGQYEPTSLSTGILLLLIFLVFYGLINRSAFPIRAWVTRHATLVIVLAILLALAITNTVSIGSWWVRIPIPHRLEHGLSIFRSSARFIWPSVIVMTAAVIVVAYRYLRFGALILAIALVIQIVDYSKELVTVSDRPNGRSIDFNYDEAFWGRIPSTYRVIATHPAASLGPWWSECAYAAMKTRRIGQCGYFGRVQGLESVNQSNSEAFFAGTLDHEIIYLVPVEWIRTHRARLSIAYPTSRTDTEVYQLSSLGDRSIIVIPGCTPKRCSFLGHGHQTFGQFLRDL